jgi:glycosyltransferase involved in cell wall biosynthesis
LRNTSIKNKKIIRRQTEMITRRGAFFVANSRFSASQITGSGAPAENVFVLHNGVDTSLFRPDPRSAGLSAMRASWGLGRSDVIFLFVAHNLVLKNFQLLRDVFERLAKLSERAKLVIVGKHRPRRIPGNCVYAGEIYDMPLCYQACDCLVHPTFFDSCANVVFESMSTGLPVIASDVCGADELVEEGKSGFILPVSGDDNGIEEIWLNKILLLSEDGEMRKNMGDSARDAMLGNEFERYVTRLEAIIETVIERKAGYGRQE